ncbi:hypothetical protein V6C53_12880 [Desulfocurvibacter africanus]|uniref:Uncharacterized protein n=2 Tax=Desulfocurvibacter africanus TaxID=873 RepID=F3Z1G2_DESAF|nr:hypothetical protein [Desulfocurvibacter africanus]EGJ49993.1 hypothetical protein Desaf_1657 [Desulfocurvibacter africanus subsp. africanus str. Walvis Bay]EMG36170.1 hypothetical protein PCS_03112 [Desulfocurvibacter africanus PCS]
MSRQHPQLSILSPHSPIGRLEVEITMRLTHTILRLGRSRLRLILAYQPTVPSLN